MIYAAGAIATIIMVVGMTGRGEWSQGIATVGGLLWLASVIGAFYLLSWQRGLLFLLGTFVLGAILQSILRPFLNPRGR
jgi:hypothetical protein